MSIREIYTTWAATYDTDPNLTRDLDQIVTSQTIGSTKARVILELGCGTGKNTALLAQLGEHVQALDFSEGMIAQAQAKVTAPNVTFTVADLTQRWPCADQSIDLIVCNLVLEHIADLAFIFAEAARVLAAGGRVFISELHPFRQYGGTVARFRREEEWTEIPAFVHHISDFIEAAAAQRLRIASLKEWWHEADQNAPPRLVSFVFEK